MAQARPVWLRTSLAILVGVGLGAGLASQLPPWWFGLGRAPDPVRPDQPPLSPIFEGPDRERASVPIRLVPMVLDVGQPTDLAFVPGHPDRLAVTSKWGSIHLVDLRRGLREFWVWLEVMDELECGVLGIAFHPKFERNGRFFVNHVPGEGERRTMVSEFEVNPWTLRGPRKVADLFSVPQPAGTHNGGQIAFGPDEHLYVALGDGSAGGDPHKNGQDLRNRLGTLLRMDVSTPGSATVPPDNPFVGRSDANPQIYAYGLRNPWRFTFAPDGRLIVGDVGQSRWEEVDVVQAGDNLGWSTREGTDCYAPAEDCPTEGFVPPIYAYGRYDGASITGGVVWQAPGALKDHYVFGDFVTGRLWALALPPMRQPVEEVIALGQFDVSPSAFAVDARGAVWMADFRADMIFKVEEVAAR